MIQDQLVEYIDAQLKAGIPAETLKTTLVGAGWQAVGACGWLDLPHRRVRSLRVAFPCDGYRDEVL